MSIFCTVCGWTDYILPGQTSVCIYTYMYVYMTLHMYIYTHIYTHYLYRYVYTWTYTLSFSLLSFISKWLLENVVTCLACTMVPLDSCCAVERVWELSSGKMDVSFSPEFAGKNYMVLDKHLSSLSLTLVTYKKVSILIFQRNCEK